MSASTSTSTSALPTRRQALRQLPSSVRTAGPQPGTFPAAGPQPGSSPAQRTFPSQCAPLDLNLGPSQLSAHRWTSTWDLPSSVCTVGPQRPDRMPEDMPDRMSDRMPEDNYLGYFFDMIFWGYNLSINIGYPVGVLDVGSRARPHS